MSTHITRALKNPLVLPLQYPAVVNLVGTVADLTSRVFAQPKARTGDRTRIYRLNDHVLRDIGVSHSDIGHGPAESFWRQ